MDKERKIYLENFESCFRTGLGELLDSFGEFGSDFLPPDPYSIDMQDGRTLEELSPDELERIKVVVYKTNRKDIFLHEMTFLDGNVRWAIGSNENIVI